ncbi:hypothetical protein AQUCO_00300354v1 [Aquilegia coerulea]|uniref:non-specific serine/threonine protein kinase n=1 Tax=Aquilegia coerulea TaxID=218851 RepID=A0A2G5EYQ4_AQUCA|nr:hypothetical protein AQUCO_00300354v1 [Aquilegia coerulea]
MEEEIMVFGEVKTVASLLVMDLSGQIKQFSWAEDTQAWFMFWSQPRQHCDVYRYCGAFGVCNQIGLPFCTCLNGFEPRSPKDWNLNDFSGGCMRKTSLQCGDEDGFLQVQVVKQPDNQQSLNIRSADDCKLSCLKECSCHAYALNKSCLVWNGDLFNLHQSPDGDNRLSIQLRLAAYEISSSGDLSVEHETEQGNLELPSFDFNTVAEATNNFSNKLGQGGFGPVYKGKLLDGREIAVKRLSRSSGQGVQEFKNELMLICKLQHRNLVRLLSYSIDKEEKILLYEYMPNKSLDAFIFAYLLSMRRIEWFIPIFPLM